MPFQYLSGLSQLPALTYTIGSGNLPALTHYFFLSARNRAGWTVPSNPIAITHSANSSIEFTLPPAARGVGTDFYQYIISVNTTNDPLTAIAIAEWENYEVDNITQRTLNPIVISRSAHLDLASSVAIPADLPTGADLINGMYRLVVGGLPNNAPSSYYQYQQYNTRPIDGERVLAGNWIRVGNPNVGQITSATGAGGCDRDVRSLDPAQILAPPYYNSDVPNPVKGTPIKLCWQNDNNYPLPRGTTFALEIEQAGESKTTAFNGKLIVRLRGYTDGMGGLDTSNLPEADADRLWAWDRDSRGILTLAKDLPAGAAVVWEISPFFTKSQFQDNLAPNQAIGIYISPFAQAGKYNPELWSITGDLVLPEADRLLPVPGVGATIEIKSGSAIVKSYSSPPQNPQSIAGLALDTPNQKLCIDGNGYCAIRTNPSAAEAIRAIVSTQSGSSKIGADSSSIVLSTAGGITATIAYPCDSDGVGTIRSDYPVLGDKLGAFNPPKLKLYARSGANVYPALVGASNDLNILPNPTQTVTISGLGSSITPPTNPSDPKFGLFAPPSLILATGAGSIPAGTYKIFAVYEYDGSTVSAIDLVDPSVITTSELSFSELGKLNRGWGRPVYNLADLRSISRDDTYAWQHRIAPNGIIFYFDPSSTAADNNTTTFKPSYLTVSQPGRWLLESGGSGGDMYAATYDLDNTGVVDDAQKLDGQDPSYYLDRNNHIGNLDSSNILDFNQSVASVLVMGDNLSATYNANTAKLTLNSNASLPLWQEITGDYGAEPGARLRANLNSETRILLPDNPQDSDVEIWLQRLETSNNDLIIDPNGQMINGQTGTDGIFNPSTVGLVELLTFHPNTGWLTQHDRLTYRAHIPYNSPADPQIANVGLLLHLDNNFNDSSSNNFTVTPDLGVTISTANKKFGTSAANFDGSGAINLPNNALFERSTNDWTWELWFNLDPSAFFAGSFELPVWIIGGQFNNYDAGLLIDPLLNLVWTEDNINPISSQVKLSPNTWNYLAIICASSQVTIFVNNKVYDTFATTISYDFRDWVLGGRPSNYNYFKGFYDEIRFTTIARTITSKPISAFSNL